METLLARMIFAAIALAVSSACRMRAVILGQPVSVPVLWLVAAGVVLALVAAVLLLARALVRDGLRLRPRAVVT